MKARLKLFEYPREPDRHSQLIAARNLKDALAHHSEARPLTIDRAYALIADSHVISVVGLLRREGDCAEAKDFLTDLGLRE